MKFLSTFALFHSVKRYHFYNVCWTIQPLPIPSDAVSKPFSLQEHLLNNQRVSKCFFIFLKQGFTTFFLLFFYYNCKELPPPPSLISLQTSQSTVTPAWPHLPGCPWPLPRGVQCPAPQLNISSHASSYSTIALLLVSYKILSHAFQNDTLQLFLIISVLLHQNF